MFLIVGLGNPGEKYEKTRHNAGFIVLSKMLENEDWVFNKNGNVEYFKSQVGDELVEYLKPQTFMNESGISVRYAKDKHEVSNDGIVVVYDDIDLPVGKLKISHDRGNGGHNGIRSIEQHLGTSNFTRIRIGISLELEDGKVIKPNVLGIFSKEDLETVKKLSSTVQDIIKTIVTEGREAAMNKFN